MDWEWEKHLDEGQRRRLVEWHRMAPMSELESIHAPDEILNALSAGATQSCMSGLDDLSAESAPMLGLDWYSGVWGEADWMSFGGLMSALLAERWGF